MVVSKLHIGRTLPLNKVTDGTSAPARAGVKRGFRPGEPSNLKMQIGKGILVHWALSWPTYLGGTGTSITSINFINIAGTGWQTGFDQGIQIYGTASANGLFSF